MRSLRSSNFDREVEILFSGKPAKVSIKLLANEDVDEFNVGILFRDKFGQDIFGTNTFFLEKGLSVKAGMELTVTFYFEQFNLGPGKYTLTVAAHRDASHVTDCHHWIDRSLSFEVVHGEGFFFIGLSRLEPELFTDAEKETIHE